MDWKKSNQCVGRSDCLELILALGLVLCILSEVSVVSADERATTGTEKAASQKAPVPSVPETAEKGCQTRDGVSLLQPNGYAPFPISPNTAWAYANYSWRDGSTGTGTEGLCFPAYVRGLYCGPDPVVAK